MQTQIRYEQTHLLYQYNNACHTYTELYKIKRLPIRYILSLHLQDESLSIWPASLVLQLD